MPDPPGWKVTVERIRADFKIVNEHPRTQPANFVSVPIEGDMEEREPREGESAHILKDTGFYMLKKTRGTEVRVKNACRDKVYEVKELAQCAPRYIAGWRESAVIDYRTLEHQYNLFEEAKARELEKIAKKAKVTQGLPTEVPVPAMPLTDIGDNTAFPALGHQLQRKIRISSTSYVERRRSCVKKGRRRSAGTHTTGQR
jgi:hypothetical protein